MGVVAPGKKNKIRPIVTYASETWVLKETVIQKPLVFEGKIFIGIFGPTIRSSSELPIRGKYHQ